MRGRDPKREKEWTTRLATTEARTRLPGLVQELSRLTEPAASLLERAVEIGPRSRGGTFLVAEVDARAAVEREVKLRQRLEELEDELENMAIAMFLEERLAGASGRAAPLEEVVRDLGLGALLEDPTPADSASSSARRRRKT